MKLQFKHQQFQADAAKAVADVFAGQPYQTPSYRMDQGTGCYQVTLTEEQDFTGWSNADIMLPDGMVLEHLNKVQRDNRIPPSQKLEGRFNLSIEMETGVGKTYTYIKTMYELNRQYGWSKFIVVVPSIAVREGVYKSFQVTQDHFTEEYGKKIRFFIYNSSQLSQINGFASDRGINVMIINSQAFNAKGQAARRIYMKLDELRSRRPIDIIAKTNPIIIIDEPQSVEGKQTKKNLKAFNPLMTLRYSATHKHDSIYNMVYCLDAMEAYNKHLVKKIAVKGITEIGTEATGSYIYLEGINLSKSAPTATLQFDFKGVSGIRKKSQKANIGFNLYHHSGKLSEYENGFIVKDIDGRDNSVEFINGIKIYAGDVIGRVNEAQLRRIQIRETILSHIERERQLFYKGIKVLSLFFIDEVAHYKNYDSAGQAQDGIFAQMFEEEYQDIISSLQSDGNDDYSKYLELIPACRTHAGYFSIDKKGRMVNSKATGKESSSDDIDAYDLIMKNKELLLERDPNRSPVRFIFSHSALREGWDNPNVFQICTLKQSSSEVRKRQEVGRGLRLCVNQDGERMDENLLGSDVHNINVLTVIASESYDSFAKGLQNEFAEAVADRPKKVTPELFADRMVENEKGHKLLITKDMAFAIVFDLIVNGYLDNQGGLTDKYYADKASKTIKIADSVRDYASAVIALLDSVYDSRIMQPENARSNVEVKIDHKKLNSREFKDLWSKINTKSAYAVDFDTDELVKNSISALNERLKVFRVSFKVEYGQMRDMKSRDGLLLGEAMVRSASANYTLQAGTNANHHVKYDLVGKLVDKTGLTRKAVIQILTGIKKEVFDQFKKNPEEFIIKASAIMNDQKAAAVTEHVAYKALDEKYDMDILLKPAAKGKLGINAMEANKHLYDYVVYDSENEKAFAERLDQAGEVAVYVKLPKSFFISTPAGRYSPDWAIAFKEGAGKHKYFIAETKGTMDDKDQRLAEKSKIYCAREHFKAVSNGEVVYVVVDSFEAFMQKAME